MTKQEMIWRILELSSEEDFKEWAEGYRSCYCRFVCENKCEEGTK